MDLVRYGSDWKEFPNPFKTPPPPTRHVCWRFHIKHLTQRAPNKKRPFLWKKISASCFISNFLCRFFFPHLKGKHPSGCNLSPPQNPTPKPSWSCAFWRLLINEVTVLTWVWEVELRQLSISLENSRVDPGLFHTPKVLGGLVQMILRISIGWCLGEPAVNFPGCTLSFSGCVVVSQISNQLARVTCCHQSFFFQKLYSKETVGHLCWILLLATGKYQADFDRVC